MSPQENQPAERGDTEVLRLQHRILKSEDLLCTDKVVLIAHRGEIYQLRETRNGKLILSK